jgi:N-acetylglucosamine kinase-like BadF-type ATPase
MYFVVESGSTKSDWVLIENKNSQSFYSTMGFNPYFHSSDLIEEELKKNIELAALSDRVEGIYFYGAGCSSPELNNIVKVGLGRVFKNAEIVVDHDLLACAYSTYTGRPVISCILGTGSNSCYFDGTNLSEEVPALGYILGDEGSGSFFGKQLLSSYLYKRLPAEMEKDFNQTYQYDKNDLIEFVYKRPNANVFIASFMPFIAKHKEDQFVKNMVVDGFKKFMEIHVCCFANYRDVEVNFVGSISDIFEAELREAAKEFNINIGRIIRRPVESLVEYHLNYVLHEKIC